MPTDYVMSDAVINPMIDNGYLPHFVIRRGIRAQLADRLASIANTSLEADYESKMKYVELRLRPRRRTSSTMRLARLC
jgi:hypothetical protein